MKLHDLEVFECRPYDCLITAHACEARRKKVEELKGTKLMGVVKVGDVSNRAKLDETEKCGECRGVRG